MEKITGKIITRRKSGMCSAQMIKDKSNNQIVLRIKDNKRLIMDIPFEYLYDMLIQTARKENTSYIKNSGLVRRLMTMIAGEAHTDEILDHISKIK